MTWPDWQPIETAPKNDFLVLTDGGQLWPARRRARR